MSSGVLRAPCTGPQLQLINSKSKFPAMVAGFGSGKTEALVRRGLKLKFKYPNQNIGYYLPTYGLVRDIGYERFEEILSDANIPYSLNKSVKTIAIPNKGKIIFRSMDNPASIIGYEHGHALVDELDTLPTDKAKEVWRRVLSRNRQKLPNDESNTAAVGTTPEGFKFIHERWVKRQNAKNRLLYEIIKASTYSNLRNLPSDYIDTLIEDYPPQLLEAYLMGEFVNLTAGSVYPDFDRHASHTDAFIDSQNPLKEAIHVGMDFNVNNCTAAIMVIRGGQPLLVDELTGVRDTPAMGEQLRAQYPGHHLTIYPDASGAHGSSTNASSSDIAILRQNGFTIRANSANPLVRDRVNAVNRQILNNEGHRNFLVNTHRCPVLTEGLEQQAYDKNGAPDKKTGNDHGNDALGYLLHYLFPIQSRQAIITEL